MDIPFEGQYSVFAAFLDIGDEVIMFEPYFDQYLPSVVFNGGKPVYVPLHPPKDTKGTTSNDWSIDFDELRYVISIYFSNFLALCLYKGFFFEDEHAIRKQK